MFAYSVLNLKFMYTSTAGDDDMSVRFNLPSVQAVVKRIIKKIFSILISSANFIILNIYKMK